MSSTFAACDRSVMSLGKRHNHFPELRRPKMPRAAIAADYDSGASRRRQRAAQTLFDAVGGAGAGGAETAQSCSHRVQWKANCVAPSLWNPRAYRRVAGWSRREARGFLLEYDLADRN